MPRCAAAQPWTRRRTSLEATFYPMKTVNSHARLPALCSGEASAARYAGRLPQEEVLRELHTNRWTEPNRP